MVFYIIHIVTWLVAHVLLISIILYHQLIPNGQLTHSLSHKLTLVIFYNINTIKYYNVFNHYTISTTLKYPMKYIYQLSNNDSTVILGYLSIHMPSITIQCIKTLILTLLTALFYIGIVGNGVCSQRFFSLLKEFILNCDLVHKNA